MKIISNHFLLERDALTNYLPFITSNINKCLLGLQLLHFEGKLWKSICDGKWGWRGADCGSHAHPIDIWAWPHYWYSGEHALSKQNNWRICKKATKSNGGVWLQGIWFPSPKCYLIQKGSITARESGISRKRPN